MEITRIDAKPGSESGCCYLRLEINNKDIIISACQSFNEYLNCYRNDGWKLLNGDIDDLTKEEKDAIDIYVLVLDYSQIK